MHKLYTGVPSFSSQQQAVYHAHDPKVIYRYIHCNTLHTGLILCTLLALLLGYDVPRCSGLANSSTLADGLHFLAVSLTLKASGLNWTWSMV